MCSEPVTQPRTCHATFRPSPIQNSNRHVHVTENLRSCVARTGVIRWRQVFGRGSGSAGGGWNEREGQSAEPETLIGGSKRVAVCEESRCWLRSTPACLMLAHGREISGGNQRWPCHKERRQTGLCRTFFLNRVQWYLAQKKHPPPRTLQ